MNLCGRVYANCGTNPILDMDKDTISAKSNTNTRHQDHQLDGALCRHPQIMVFIQIPSLPTKKIANTNNSDNSNNNDNKHFVDLVNR